MNQIKPSEVCAIDDMPDGADPSCIRQDIMYVLGETLVRIEAVHYACK